VFRTQKTLYILSELLSDLASEHSELLGSLVMGLEKRIHTHALPLSLPLLSGVESLLVAADASSLLLTPAAALLYTVELYNNNKNPVN
jgi:hypothetical protein